MNLVFYRMRVTKRRGKSTPKTKKVFDVLGYTIVSSSDIIRKKIGMS